MAYIISELHGQYGGKIGVAEQMILQSKFGGADAVKVQLYSPEFDSNARNYDKPGDFLSLPYEDLKKLQAWAKGLHIDFFASFFDEERLSWCLELDFPILKVANWVTINKPELVEKAIASGKTVLISLNNEQLKKDKPYTAKNVKYLYTEPKYPGMLEDLTMPAFDDVLVGYSCQASGMSATLYALAHGATVIEKHFTIAHGWQKTKEKAHLGSMTVDELRAMQEFARGFDILRNKKLFQFDTTPNLF